ncbi:hypothetical protein [uncultured Croceitalea sp.]|uniref:hypothetical protein n=1 Tax=uncultured Croceitalea sp. TaxID=1798908 RepID=UPI003305614E
MNAFNKIKNKRGIPKSSMVLGILYILTILIYLINDLNSSIVEESTQIAERTINLIP